MDSECVSGLASLDGDALCRLWPRERVSTGLQVCKAFAETLRSAPWVVLRVSRLASHKWGQRGKQAGISEPRAGCDAAETVSSLLLQFSAQHSSVELLAPRVKEHAAVLRGLSLATDRQFRGLVGLDLKQNRLDDAAIISLSLSLHHCSSLSHLDLSQNRCGAAGAEGLCGAFTHLPLLKSLHLGSNFLGACGGAAVAGKLPLLSSIVSLDLRSNDLEEDAARCLADALPHCMYLTDLDLEGNELGCRGVELLAPALSSCPSLSILNLAGNAIGPNGARALAEELPR
ncbi:hypothetical protein T484DRAFT_1953330, partial [Baffinella frigidus]